MIKSEEKIRQNLLRIASNLRKRFPGYLTVNILSSNKCESDVYLLDESLPRIVNAEAIKYATFMGIMDAGNGYSTITLYGNGMGKDKPHIRYRRNASTDDCVVHEMATLNSNSLVFSKTVNPYKDESITVHKKRDETVITINDINYIYQKDNPGRTITWTELIDSSEITFTMNENEKEEITSCKASIINIKKKKPIESTESESNEKEEDTQKTSTQESNTPLTILMGNSETEALHNTVIEPSIFLDRLEEIKQQSSQRINGTLSKAAMYISVPQMSSKVHRICDDLKNRGERKVACLSKIVA